MQIDFFEIKENSDFGKNLDRFVKKKRFISLPYQIKELIEAFQRGEFQGERIMHSDIPVHFDVYKLRLPNPDANAGKSNGYRVIYLVITEVRLVVFLTIYYKKETTDISDGYIRGLIEGCLLDMLPEEP